MIKCRLSIILGDRLEKISDVSKATGISRTTLHSLYYRRAKGIQYSTLTALCDYFGCQPGELLEYVEEEA